MAAESGGERGSQKINTKARHIKLQGLYANWKIICMYRGHIDCDINNILIN